MEVTTVSRRALRIQNAVFVALFLAVIGLLGWLSNRYSMQLDWTASGRNTLSEASVTLLERMSGPVHITAYAREEEILRKGISELVGRYQRHKPDLALTFVDPNTVPQRVRQLGVTIDGELLIEYQGRTEHLKTHSEEALTNALQRVLRAGERWLAYLTGHGERDLLGNANHDLGTWGEQLENRGFKVQPLNLGETDSIPDNASALVIAGPKVDLLPGEVAIVEAYLDAGGKLLWLQDPGPLRGLDSIAGALGIAFQAGVIVDPTTRLFGISDPSFALVTRYAPHSVTRTFKLLTLFPEARGIALKTPQGWEGEAILKTGDRVWSETGELAGEIRFDEGADIAGPFSIGVALSRRLTEESEAEPAEGEAQAEHEQRVVVIGDGDFLSNAYLGNSGNLDLGLNIVNWLASDDSLIAIPAKSAPDLHLDLTPAGSMLVAFGTLFILPASLFAAGVVIWLKRRKR